MANDFNNNLQAWLALQLARLQQQRQQQTQNQNQTDTISNIGNPIVNVNVTNTSINSNSNLPQPPAGCDCNYEEVERQVNDPVQDIVNFPRITQSETSLARFNDFILYGFNDSNNVSFSGFSFSNDLGKTWNDSGNLPINPGGVNSGDPSIAVDRNGIFYYAQVGGETIPPRTEPEGVISVSTGTINPNRTITMNPPQIVGQGQVASDVGNQDKPWIAVGPDIQSGDEALYIVWTDFTPTGLPNIRFSKFRTGINLTPIIQNQDIVIGGTTHDTFGAFPVIDSRGNIYVFYEDRLPNSFTQLGTQNRSIRMVKSIDGGNTFQTPVEVSNGLFEAAATDVVTCGFDMAGNPMMRPVILVSPERVIRMFEIPQASIGEDGTIYVVWHAGRVNGNNTFINVHLAYSQDGGMNWNQVRVTNDLPYSYFPSIAVNCKGAHIQYNRFNDPNGVGNVGNGTFGIFMKTFSITTGLSNEKIVSNPSSPVPITNPNFDPGIRDCYMAEYNQVIKGPGSCLLHSWGDNRNILNGQNNPDVFFKLKNPQ